MNLLPKCHEDFSKADYWNTFFKKRGKKSFEWYGEYPELCGVLSKFVKTKDDILVVGCGNSTLSMDLHDVGYRNITSIDISKIVIDQMRDKNRLDKRDLIFEQMDATSMSYPDDKFSVIIDKGTLDALMPDTSNETQKTIDRFFSEVARVLRRGGRYICISLLQEHILRKFIEFFASKDFMLRITRCHEAENKTREEEGSAIPVFAIMATKFPGLSQKVLELALTDNSSAVRIPNEEELINSILAVQQSALVCDRLSKKSLSDVGEVNLDLYSPGNDEPKYTIYVLDRPGARGKTYAAFLVPQGRETDWLFATPGGRKHFLENVDKDRVAIVILGRNHIFKNWDEIKIELASSIKNLSPPGLPANYVIDYLSLGADVGKRELLHQGESKYSGKYLIEDVISDDENSRTRRLIFMDNKFVVQSEAEMKLVKSRRGKSKFVVNPGVLAGEYHAQICVAVNSLVQDDEKKEILVIGLGGGGLCLFLRHCYPKMNITAVDIDESMLEIATNWFDFVLDDKTKVKIEDGIKYLENARMENKKFDGIIFDVDGKDPSLGMCCPPVQFLDALVLENVRKCLNKNGMFILNFVCRDKSLRPGVLEKLRNQFTSVTSMKMKVFLNEVFVAQNDGKRGEDEWRKEWKESVDDLNRKVRNKKLLTSDVIDATELLDELTIEA